MQKLLLKRLVLVVFLVSITTSLVGCVHVVHTRTTVVQKSKPLPPGQAKKINGDKSAKNYTKKRR